MGQVADRHVGAQLQVEVAAAGGQHERAVDGGCPDDVTVHQPVDVFEDRISVLGGFAHLGVDLGGQQHRVRAVDTGQPELGQRLGDDVRNGAGVVGQLQRRVAAGAADALDRCGGVALEDGPVFGEGQLLGGDLDRIPVGILRAALHVVDLRA